MLPTPLRLLKRALRILKSSLSPDQIALSFALGLVAGLPPMGIHVLIPCSIALILRVSLRGFLWSIALWKLLSVAVAPGAYALGKWLLDPGRGLDGLWRRLFALPVIAPMHVNRFLLLGDLVIALSMAVPVFFVVRQLVIGYRAQAASRFERTRLAVWFRRIPGGRWIRWFMLGGVVKYNSPTPRRGIFRIVRREAIALLAASYGAAYLLAALIVPWFAGGLATSTTSWIVGSEVEVADSSFSLFSGKLALEGLTVQDPDRPEFNVLEIPRLTLDVAMPQLVSQRVVFDAFVIEDAALHVERDEDGSLNIDNFQSGWDPEPYLAWAAVHADRVDWTELLSRFLQSLSNPRPLPSRRDSLARFAGGRSFEPFRPTFAIERLEIGRVALSFEDRRSIGGGLPSLTLLEVELENVALPSALSDEPVALRLRGRFDHDPSSGFSLEAVFTQEEEIAAREQIYTITVDSVDLVPLASAYATSLAVAIDSGRLSLEAQILSDGTGSSGSVQMALENLHVSLPDGSTLFGLPADLAAQMIDGLNRYAAEVPVVIGFGVTGDPDSVLPQPAWEAPLLEIAREGLMMIGRREALAAAEQLGLEIEALGGLPDGVLSGEYEQLQGAAREAAAGLIEQSVQEAFDIEVPQRPNRTAPSGEEPFDQEGDSTLPWIDRLLERISPTDE